MCPETRRCCPPGSWLGFEQPGLMGDVPARGGWNQMSSKVALSPNHPVIPPFLDADWVTLSVGRDKHGVKCVKLQASLPLLHPPYGAQVLTMP